MKRGAYGEVVVAPLALGAAAAALVLFVGGMSADRRPQRTSGGDVLSVAFGDAKAVISAAMVHKADSYFHGGVDMECHDEACHAHSHHAADGDHPSSETHHSSLITHHFSFDPWSWINRHVRAPEVERHLAGEQAVELLPWLWASVRADPHNVDAWTTAWHVADVTMGDSELAARVIAEARRANPASLEIMLCEARTVFDRGRGDVRRARDLFAAIRQEAERRCGGRLGDLPENDVWMHRFAGTYIAECEKILNSAK